MPDSVTAYARCRSEQNYQKMEDGNIDAFVKFNYSHKEQREGKKGNAKNTFTAEKLHYNKESDCYCCPMVQEMANIGRHQKTKAKIP